MTQLLACALPVSRCMAVRGALRARAFLVVFAVWAVLTVSTTASAQWTFVRGDSNGDSTLNIADPVMTLGHLFNSGPSPCRDAMDGNDDGALNIADPVFVLTYLFSAGPNPAAPFPTCGLDPTPDALDCLGPLPSCPASACSVLLGGCPSGTFCQTAVGDCAGSGVCTPFPVACPAIFDPVCGCDNLTYSNACEAAMAGVNVQFTGVCPVAACTLNTDCPSGEFCMKAVGDCNGTGTCEAMPLICPAIFDPVCGCDGLTYGNACEAAQVGMNVELLGACPVAGCTTNAQCPPGEYCAKALGDCNGSGNCVVMPFFCPAIFDPHCGCDGATYSNACVAASFGINVATAGPCP